MDANEKLKEKEARFANINASHTFKNIVRAFALDKKSVLDIGCSFGEFLIHFGTGSVGIAITENEVAFGATKGLDMRLGDIESDSFVLNERFDTIFANNLFEHMYSPHRFLTNVQQYLKPSGILILGVPCLPKIVSLLRVRKFRGSLAGTHINFFTRDTLINTVERGGYTILATRGFRFKNAFIDHLFDWVYPHFYVIAKPGSTEAVQPHH